MPTQEAPFSISKNATLNLPLALPWTPSLVPVLPGTTFHSKLCTTTNPWSKVSPFDTSSLDDISIQYRNDDGGIATYQSAETATSCSSSEHLCVAFGISVGCVWLGDNVTGGYDKDTLENNDACKTSLRASFRAGSLVFERRPRLSKEAMEILRHEGGIPAFKERFGDYYVAGYRLGGDAGVLVSESKSESATIERLSVKVTVKVLFAKISKTHEKFFRSASATSCYRISGFDTLDQFLIPTEAPVTFGSGLEGLIDRAKDMEKRCFRLAERVTKEVEALKLEQGEELGQELLEALLKSHLVVEIILLPISTLREVIEWSSSSDII